MTSALALNPYILENPQKVATELKRKAFQQDLLSKICYVATAAIFSATLTIAFGLIAPTPAISLLLFALVLSTAFIIYPAAGKFQERAKEFKSQSEFESLVAEKLKEIKDLGVNEFFAKNLPGKELPKIEDLKMLLPLIARYLVEKERADGSYEKLKEADLEKDPRIGQPLLQFRLRQYKNQGIPAALNAAWLLRVVENPFLQGKNYLGSVEIRKVVQLVGIPSPAEIQIAFNG